MKPLKQCTVNTTVFYNILKTMNKYVKEVDNINDYYSGYPDRSIIRYGVKNNNKYLICLECLLNQFIDKDDKIPEVTYWKQIIVRLNEGQVRSAENDITGLYAFNYMNKQLEKVYTKQEIYSIIESFNTPYNEKLKQFHYDYPNPYDKIVKHENCYKYDINSAYASELIKIFPKASNIIMKLYNERKDHPNNKKFLNYYIGYWKHKGYDGFYNYIVQNISRQLQGTILQLNGVLLYANTDGLIIKNPKNMLTPSKEIGQFKLEYQGDVYTYKDKNYMCYQYGDDIVGNLRLCVRHLVDLSQGKVVHYTINRSERYEQIENVQGEIKNEK